jgi:hypothetical protein
VKRFRWRNRNLLLAVLLFSGVCHAAKPAKGTDANALIAEAAYLVSLQDDKPADEVRALDKKLDALQARFAGLGEAAIPALSREMFDEKQEVKTRLWLVLYLQSVRSVETFPPLRRMTLDPAQPDTLRDAAARALAGSEAGKAARSRALCEALGKEPGPLLRREALFELSRLGCEDPSVLERAAAAGGAKPKGPAAAEADLALAALERSAPPSAVDALDRLLRRYAKGTPERARALDALTARASQLQLERARWKERGEELLREESRHPANQAAALRLLGALGDASAAEACARHLADPDPHVVTAAAEALAALQARDRAPAVEAVLSGYYTDPRFANGPGVDPTALYDRLAAALKALK